MYIHIFAVTCGDSSEKRTGIFTGKQIEEADELPEENQNNENQNNENLTK